MCWASRKKHDASGMVSDDGRHVPAAAISRSELEEEEASAAAACSLSAPLCCCCCWWSCLWAAASPDTSPPTAHATPCPPPLTRLHTPLAVDASSC